jgi:hypothetical protein
MGVTATGRVACHGCVDRAGSERDWSQMHFGCDNGGNEVPRTTERGIKLGKRNKICKMCTYNSRGCHMCLGASRKEMSKKRAKKE